MVSTVDRANTLPKIQPTNTGNSHLAYCRCNLLLTMAPTRLLPTVLLLLSTFPTAIDAGFFKKKHRRQKAGTKYNDHDPVHVVVNKVG